MTTVATALVTALLRTAMIVAAKGNFTEIINENVPLLLIGKVLKSFLATVFKFEVHSGVNLYKNLHTALRFKSHENKPRFTGLFLVMVVSIVEIINWERFMMCKENI